MLVDSGPWMCFFCCGIATGATAQLACCMSRIPKVPSSIPGRGQKQFATTIGRRCVLKQDTLPRLLRRSEGTLNRGPPLELDVPPAGSFHYHSHLTKGSLEAPEMELPTDYQLILEAYPL